MRNKRVIFGATLCLMLVLTLIASNSYGLISLDVAADQGISTMPGETVVVSKTITNTSTKPLEITSTVKVDGREETLKTTIAPKTTQSVTLWKGVSFSELINIIIKEGSKTTKTVVPLSTYPPTIYQCNGNVQQVCALKDGYWYDCRDYYDCYSVGCNNNRVVTRTCTQPTETSVACVYESGGQDCGTLVCTNGVCVDKCEGVTCSNVCSGTNVVASYCEGGACKTSSDIMEACGDYWECGNDMKKYAFKCSNGQCVKSATGTLSVDCGYNPCQGKEPYYTCSGNFIMYNVCNPQTGKYEGQQQTECTGFAGCIGSTSQQYYCVSGEGSCGTKTLKTNDVECGYSLCDGKPTEKTICSGTKLIMQTCNPRTGQYETTYEINDCVGHTCQGTDKYTLSCLAGQSACKETLVETKSTTCGYNPCTEVDCGGAYCSGNDVYQKTCQVQGTQGVCIQSSAPAQQCGGLKCNGADLYINKCMNGQCQDVMQERSNADCVAELCASCRTTPYCDGLNLYTETCSNGACVKQLVTANAQQCIEETCSKLKCKTTPFCEGLSLYRETCSGTQCIKEKIPDTYGQCESEVCATLECESKTVCEGDKLYGMKCEGGACVKGLLKTECDQAKCGCDPCKGVNCYDLCVEGDLVGQSCKDGECVKGAVKEVQSVKCSGNTIKDSDIDGVPDYLDKCPTVVGVVFAERWAEYSGCPDSDIDGVPNVYGKDKCPTVKGDLVSGCPSTTCDAYVKDILAEGKSIMGEGLSVTGTLRVDFQYANEASIKETEIYAGDSLTPVKVEAGALDYYDFPIEGGIIKGRIVTTTTAGCVSSNAIYHIKGGGSIGSIAGILPPIAIGLFAFIVVMVFISREPRTPLYRQQVKPKTNIPKKAGKANNIKMASRRKNNRR